MLKNVVFLVCLFVSLFVRLAFFVCLFVWSLQSHSRIFHSHGDVTIASEGLKIQTYVRHSWQLSSEGSLACQNLLQHGPTVYNGHLRGTVTHTPVAERLGVELSLLVSVAIGGRPHISPMPGERTTSSPRGGGGLLDFKIMTRDFPFFEFNKLMICQTEYVYF